MTGNAILSEQKNEGSRNYNRVAYNNFSVLLQATRSLNCLYYIDTSVIASIISM